MSQFNLMTHKFYEAKISLPRTKEILPYNYFHPCDPQLSRQLDFDQSIFYETKWTFRESVIKIESYDHYLELKAKDKEAKFGAELDEIVVNRHFDKTLDLFAFIPFSSSLYVTKRVKDELEKNKIIGLSFEEAPEIKI